MSGEENKALALEFIEEVYNKGRLELVERYVSPDVLTPSAVPGLEGVSTSISSLREALSELDLKVVDSMGQDDRVALRIVGKGIQSGPLMGLPPTGKKMNFWGLMVLRFRAGKIVELWTLIDIPGILKQMRG